MNRKDAAALIIRNAYLNQDGHIASALSVLDCIQCLYDKVLTEDDEFVLSKGHASLALYVVLLDKGIITEDEFFSFGQFDSRLGGHPSSRHLPDIRFSAGSLGHGFPYAVGLALGKKIHNDPGRVYCLIGDGEANEGTIWESALVAHTYQLDNMVCLMDFNKSGERAIRLSNGTTKFRSFGWRSHLINGHSRSALLDVIGRPSLDPVFIQLNTIKGKGCPIMENNPEWHHKWPTTQDEYEEIILSLSD